MRGSVLVGFASCLAAAGAAAGDGACVVGWSDPGTAGGPSGPGYAFAVYDAGSGPALFVGGSFASADGHAVNSIAAWDGSAWSPQGGGVSGEVYALAVMGEGPAAALYAGGAFAKAGGVQVNNIARWDGQAWQALGSGTGGAYPYVEALTVFDDGNGPALYAGGSFGSAGGVQVNRIARWDGSGWSALGDGVGPSALAVVTTMAAFDDGSGPALYVGGSFLTAAGGPGNNIARWDGKTWSPVGAGFNMQVNALAVFDDGSGSALYAGGIFNKSGLQSVKGIARWDGYGWQPVGGGVDGGGVQTLVGGADGPEGPALYAGGSFTGAGGKSAPRIARWDGSAWHGLGKGANAAVSAVALFDDGLGAFPTLYAGGGFTMVDERPISGVARWGCEPCPADKNGDGKLDFFDFVAFVGEFNMQDMAADCDQSGVLNVFDFLCYTSIFNSGC